MLAVSYWSGTEYAPDATSAWGFRFYNGNQGSTNKDFTLYMLAVRHGERAIPAPATPVPASGTVGLIILGAAGLMLIYGRRKTNIMA